MHNDKLSTTESCVNLQLCLVSCFIGNNHSRPTLEGGERGNGSFLFSIGLVGFGIKLG